MWFDTLVGILSELKERLLPFTVISEYEAGIILRLGKYHHTLQVGLNWKIPIFDNVLSADVKTNTMNLDAQSLITSDLKEVIVSTVVRYRIRAIEPYFLEVVDQDNSLEDIVLSEVKAAVTEHPYKDLPTLDSEVILNRVRKIANPLGFKIDNISFVDMGKFKSLRLIQSAG